MPELRNLARGSYLNLLRRHDDAQRENAYNHSAENIQKIARDRQWTEISMKSDIKSIFADFREDCED